MPLRRGWELLSSVLIGAALWMAPRQATACSCAPALLLSPQAGSTNVPLNAAIVYVSRQSPVTLVERNQNLEVPITIEPFPRVAGVLLIRPNQLLQPNTTYEMRALTGVTAELSTFTTGTSTDDEAPTYGGITSFSADTIYPGDGCRTSCSPLVGPIRRVRFDLPAPPADTSLFLLEMRAPDATAIQVIPIYRFWSSPNWPRAHTDGSYAWTRHQNATRSVALTLLGATSGVTLIDDRTLPGARRVGREGRWISSEAGRSS